ncbi:MAG TPA: hypothetical protein VN901_05990 [Candidatus Acidoferrales bacterium]|nr:hypothetical protein [Candidatus Acidoferrales bacterium]
MQKSSLQQPDQIDAIQASNDAETRVRCSDVVALFGEGLDQTRTSTRDVRMTVAALLV